MAPTNIEEFYKDIIKDVISTVRNRLLSMGVDEQVLVELQETWESKLLSTQVLLGVNISQNEGGNYQQGGLHPGMGNVQGHNGYYPYTYGGTNTSKMNNHIPMGSVPMPIHYGRNGQPHSYMQLAHNNVAIGNQRAMNRIHQQMMTNVQEKDGKYMYHPGIYQNNQPYMNDPQGINRNNANNYMDNKGSNYSDSIEIETQGSQGLRGQEDGLQEGSKSTSKEEIENSIDTKRELNEEIEPREARNQNQFQEKEGEYQYPITTTPLDNINISDTQELRNKRRTNISLPQVEDISEEERKPIGRTTRSKRGTVKGPKKEITISDQDIRDIMEGKIPQLDGDDYDDNSDNELDSDDDDSDDDSFADCENTVICQYEKVTRTKSQTDKNYRAKIKWKCNFKDGIMNIDNIEYIFNKGVGELEWI